jgi:tRNA pseudouridine38-40 synthase
MSQASERNFSARVAYDGTDYAGFQVQPEDPTIQGELEKALAKILGTEIRVHGASRTDAGVHAVGQVVSFRAATTLPAAEIERALNALLPGEIRAWMLMERDNGFHARFSAWMKRYAYRIYRSPHESPFLGRFAYWRYGELDEEGMRRCADLLGGEHDFRSFSPRLYEGEKPMKMIETIEMNDYEELYEISVTGSGFLYQMVRRMCAAILEAGRGGQELEEVESWLDTPVTGACKHLLPPNGLFLMEVMY